MKKTTEKGFTLIELLAVIVILAIIALIAVPVIMNIINKANKSAFKDTAYGIISAGELYFAEQQLNPLGMSENVEIELPDTTKALELKGEVPPGKILITKDGKIALFIKNNRYCITKGIDDKDITVTENYETCELPGEENNGGGNDFGDSGDILDNEWPIIWKQSEVDENVSFTSPNGDSNNLTMWKVSDLQITKEEMETMVVVANDGTKTFSVELLEPESWPGFIGTGGALSYNDSNFILYIYSSEAGTYEEGFGGEVVTIPESGLYYGFMNLFDFSEEGIINGVDFQFTLTKGN